MAPQESNVFADDQNDDDFDWDAAVREIDVACEIAKTSETPYFVTPEAPLPANDRFAADKRRNGTSRQSTLDKFISRVAPVPRYGAVSVDDRTRMSNNGGESCIEIDAEAAKTWIYPVNIPLRDYQFAITKTALFTNTLVALPTGLGKTLVAAVVMYNYFRWFPEGKIVFTAPSRPLVVQQIEACHNIVGIPQEWSIDMTGQLSPTKRAQFWKTKRVFFVTPQVLEKDIQSGTCLVKHLVCLVIDEAHRAMGNYSYCVAVRELMAIPVQLRLLALTATPGSKQQTIQQVIDNLLISALEFRDESDPDVCSYVHNRKIELIEVAMGEEATKVTDLLLSVIRVLATRLNGMGILLSRDCQTLSPADLLNSRDKFRQAPPQNLPQEKFGDVERLFGALITLYHIRKLLSSHGIKPAYEMLEEKLHRGSFAALLSRNEDIHKAKLLMQRNLSDGPPNPKLSKMLEVLIDHFRINDPQSSRVIIFSNFRGSVRDIMDALSKVGDVVKAAQFIGQSTGKALKGQTQKVQQAVLEKFRAGGFNVIVATSIGEEGLDIMEVDLVICFDANVSPLRMIQRMGRTGRKHDGRVVVLACEGSEMKGYLRKQAHSRSVRKHMRNGGIASFNFHLSPRMVPHIYKPEVQLTEMAIEKYVPRGKKVKEDQLADTPNYRQKLTDEEANIIAKYFHSPEIQRKPSLIAFPHFQTFPSRVHRVKHSCRTGMLIDSMQHLQGLTFSSDKDEEEVSSIKPLGIHSGRQDNSNGEEENACDEKGFIECCDSPETNLDNMNQSFPDRSPRILEEDKLPESPPSHSYCFGSDFVTVDPLGNVLILSVPSFAAMRISHSRENDAVLHCSKKDSRLHSFSAGNLEDHRMQAESAAERASQQNERLHMVDKDVEILAVDDSDILFVTPDAMEAQEPSLCPDGVADDSMEIDLSPRLTSYILSGVVPESPVRGAGPSISKETDGFLGMEVVSSPKEKEPATPAKENVFPFSPADYPKESSIIEVKNDNTGENRQVLYGSPVDQVPMETSTSGNSTKDWCFSPSGNLRSVNQHRKLKRLRRIGENENDDSVTCLKERLSVPMGARNTHRTNGIRTIHKRGKQRNNLVRPFIDEEAEVSPGADSSDEEELDDETDSIDDSFIDDRVNPSAATTTPGGSGPVDMMAIYRRSLLSQSPIAWQPNSASTSSPDSVSVRATRLSDIGASSSKHNTPPLQHPVNIVIPETGEESKVESKKRKLGFQQTESFPAVNLEKEFLVQSDVRNVELATCNEQQQGEETLGAANDYDPFSDDQFYEDIDLDEVEAQATLLLKQTLEQKKPENVPAKLDITSFGYLSSPSFDLGI